MTTTSVLRVQVMSSKLLFVYSSAFGQREVEFIETIPSNAWTHVALQVNFHNSTEPVGTTTF